MCCIFCTGNGSFYRHFAAYTALYTKPRDVHDLPLTIAVETPLIPPPMNEFTEVAADGESKEGGEGDAGSIPPHILAEVERQVGSVFQLCCCCLPTVLLL